MASGIVVEGGKVGRFVSSCGEALAEAKFVSNGAVFAEDAGVVCAVEFWEDVAVSGVEGRERSLQGDEGPRSGCNRHTGNAP